MAIGNIKCDMGSTAEGEDGHSVKLTTYPKAMDSTELMCKLNVNPQTFKCQNAVMWAYLREINRFVCALKHGKLFIVTSVRMFFAVCVKITHAVGI